MWPAATASSHGGGRFVFTVMHPCFNTNGSRLAVEEEDRDGELVTTYAVKVVEYLKLAPARGLGIVGQPAPHYDFHRPLHILLASCFSAGFVVDGLEEPAFAHEVDAARPLNWSNFTNIPPVLAVRLRPYPSETAAVAR